MLEGLVASDPGASEATRADILWRGGDWAAAEESFQRAILAIDAGPLPPAIAWRFGALLYLQVDRARAEHVLASADGTTGSSSDAALVAAWLSAAAWRNGRVDEAADHADAACRHAGVERHPRAIAAAEVARALVCASRGDRIGNTRAYRAAYRAAEEADDVIQTGRILANLSSKALEEGDYQAAVDHANRALEVAEKHRPIMALALENKAEALIRQGRLDAARAAAAEAVEAYAAEGSFDLAGPEMLLG